MKKNRLLWSIPVLLLGLLSACEQEQTSLNIDAISGQATIKGRVIYQAGETQTGNYVGEVWNAASSQTVYAYLSNADLTGNASANGETSYSAVINDDGDYTLTLPATASGVSVRLEFPTIEGTYSQVSGIESTGSLQYQTLSGYYKAPSVSLVIKNEMAYISDCDAYTFTARSVLNETESSTTDYVKLSGQLTYSAKTRSTDSLTLSDTKKAAVGQKILVKKNSSWYSALSKSVTVGETSVAVFEVYLPIEETSETTTLTFSPVGYEGIFVDYILSGGKYKTSNNIKGKYNFDGTNSSQTITLEKGFTSFVPSPLNYTFTAYPDYAQ